MTVNMNKLSRYLPAATLTVLLLGAAPHIVAGTDPNAGNWQMIVLSGPTQIPVAAPAPITDSGYLAELAAVKSAQGSITASQRQAMDYWNRGGVFSWNQILVAPSSGWRRSAA